MSIADKLQIIAENEQKVFNAGAKSEYDRFWDELQENGNRIHYFNAFASAIWTKETFKPKYPIIIDTKGTTNQNYCVGIFANFMRNQDDDECIDLNDIGVKIDFSKAGIVQNVFQNSKFENVEVDFSNAQIATNAFGMGNGGGIRNITVKVSDKLTQANNFFYYNAGLRTLTFTEDSVIAFNNMNLSHATLLERDSLMTVINALKDYSGDTSGTTWKVTFGNVLLAKLTDADKQIATNKGWVLA